MVEARNVPISSLAAEVGGALDECLENMDRYRNDRHLYEFFTGQSNFELNRPVPVAQLRFYEVRQNDRKTKIKFAKHSAIAHDSERAAI